MEKWEDSLQYLIEGCAPFDWRHHKMRIGLQMGETLLDCAGKDKPERKTAVWPGSPFPYTSASPEWHRKEIVFPLHT